MEKRELTTEEWKAEKKKKKAQMMAMQALPYEVKVKRAERRAIEYVEKLDDMGLNAHVSVGGLDSIVLLLFLRNIGIDVPAISVSALEDKSIQRIHRELGVIPIMPGKPKVQILQEYGFPVISKRIAGKIDTLQHPTDKNKTVRHAIITGECGAQGHHAKNSRMKLPQKWLELFAGYENENEGVNYQIAPFKVSNKCCLYMKEKPCDRWAKEHNSRPFLGLMASEGGQREEALTEHGCNYFGKGVIRSAPFTPFLRQDILTLALEMDAWWKMEERRNLSKRAIGRMVRKSPINWKICPKVLFRIFMEPLNESRMERCTPQAPKGLDVVCVASGYTWRSGPIGSISSGSRTRRNGSFGCTGAAQTRRRERSSVGVEYWTTLALGGRMCGNRRQSRWSLIWKIKILRRRRYPSDKCRSTHTGITGNKRG